MKSRWVAVAFSASLMTLAMPARADTNTSAQALFEEGRRLMAAGQYAEACPKFAESQRLDPGAGTLLNLALCYEKNEQLASAWATYNEAAADADRSGRPEWVKRGKDKAATLAPSLTTLSVTVPKNARIDGLEVTRDGQPISAAEWGVKVPIDGGDHVVEAHAPGHDAWSTHVNAPAKSGALTVSVPVLAKSTVATKPDITTPKPHERDHSGGPEKPAQKGSTQRTIGVVLGAAGVIGLGLGGGFALNAMSKHNAAKKDCSADEARCGPQGLADYSDANKSADVATIAFIAGGALLVGGIVLYLTSPRGAVSTTALLRPGWTF
jgi:tetratricopeptide (TPR) repeat protein